jgi:hypothetical protein
MLWTMVLTLSIPMLNIEIGVAEATAIPAMPTELVLSSTQLPVSAYLLYLVAGIYFVGASWQLLRQTWGVGCLILLLRNSHKSKYEGYLVAVHPEFRPSSFFGFVLLPEYPTGNPQEQLILLHESEHIRQLHSIDLMLIQAIKILFWFHPLLEKFEKALHEVHEYQADAAVTGAFSKTTYAQLLIHMAADPHRHLPVNHFAHSQLKNRILMMNRTESTLKQKARFFLALPLLGIAMALFSCKEKQATPDMGALNAIEITTHVASKGKTAVPKRVDWWKVPSAAYLVANKADNC